MSKKGDIMEMDPPVTAVDAKGRRPILVVTSGRGRTGKSVLLSLLATLNAGRYPLKVIDADKNGSLSDRYPHAVRPDVPVGEDRRVWIEAQFDKMVEAAGTDQKHDMFLDLGAGDLLLSRWGHEVQLAQALSDMGVEPVLIHTLDAAEQDVRDLSDLEMNGVFAPQKTIVVLNIGLIAPGRDAVTAFDQVLKSEPVTAIQKRGGRIVWLPPFEGLGKVEEKRMKLLRFSDILSKDGLRDLGFLDQIRARKWLRDQVPASLSVVADWLPEMVDLSEKRA